MYTEEYNGYIITAQYIGGSDPRGDWEANCVCSGPIRGYSKEGVIAQAKTLVDFTIAQKEKEQDN